MKRLQEAFGGRGLLVFLFLLSLPFVTSKMRGADEIQYFSYLHSVIFDHDLDFGNEYQYFYDADPKGLAAFKATFMDRREAVTHRPLNFCPIGSALLWSPFYLLAHAAVLLARAFGAHLRADGLSRPYSLAVCYGSSLYGFLGLILTHDGLRRFGGLPEPAARWSVASLWFGTPVVYYMTVAPGFAHACSLFLVSLIFWLWLGTRRQEASSVWSWVGIGIAGGLAALVREQHALFLAIPCLDLVLHSRGRLGSSLLRAVAMGLSAALAFSPQLVVYRVLNGHLGPSHLVTRKMSYTSPHFLQVLVDPGHGLFFWTPLLLLATAGLALLLIRRRDSLAALLVLAFLLQVWMNGSIESWTQAGAFGSRRFVEVTPVFAWGLAALLVVGVKHFGRLWTATVLGLFVWWNVSLMVQFGLKLMDRQRLEWPRVARNQFVEVPPRLARTFYLFVTDPERLRREVP